jgi:hypothetical protein
LEIRKNPALFAYNTNPKFLQRQEQAAQKKIIIAGKFACSYIQQVLMLRHRIDELSEGN